MIFLWATLYSVKSFENLLLIIWDFTDEYLRHKSRPVLSDNCSVPENFYGGAQTPSHLTESVKTGVHVLVA